MATVEVRDESHIIVEGVAYHAEPTPGDGLCVNRCAFAREGACTFEYTKVGCMACERKDQTEITWVRD